MRFHQISTDEVYGSFPLDGSKKFDESSPYNPRNPYSATKVAARMAAEECAMAGIHCFHVSTDYVFDGERG